jgi:hypothetical protein
LGFIQNRVPGKSNLKGDLLKLLREKKRKIVRSGVPYIFKCSHFSVFAACLLGVWSKMQKTDVDWEAGPQKKECVCPGAECRDRRVPSSGGGALCRDGTFPLGSMIFSDITQTRADV